jgi:hypothetical protein
MESNNLLNRDVFSNILLNVTDLKDLFNYCKTDKTYASICSNNIFWKKKVYHDFPDSYNEIITSRNKTISTIPVEDDISRSNEGTFWKDTYIKLYTQSSYENGKLYPLFEIIKYGSAKDLDEDIVNLRIDINEVDLRFLTISAINHSNYDIVSYLLSIDNYITVNKIIFYISLIRSKDTDIINLLLNSIDNLLKVEGEEKRGNIKYQNYLTISGSLIGSSIVIDRGLSLGGSLFIATYQAIKHDKTEIFRFIPSDSDISVYNNLLFIAGYHSSNNWISLLLSVKGIETTSLLYGASKGGHFTLVQYYIDNYKSSIVQLTMAVGFIDKKYSPNHSYTLKLLQNNGADISNFISLITYNIDINNQYSREWLDKFPIYLRIAYGMIDQKELIGITDSDFDNVTQAQANEIFEKFILRFAQIHVENPYRYLDFILEKIHNINLNDFALIARNSKDYLRYLVERGSSNVDEILQTLSTDESTITIESTGELYNNEDYLSIARYLVSKGASLDELVDHLLSVYDSIDYFNDLLGNIYALLEEYSRTDLVELIEYSTGV